MIIFSAITPHSPLLIPSIGKESREMINMTAKSFEELEKTLYASKPDTILIVSPHGPLQKNVFSMNLSPRFIVDFEEFGDFATKMEFDGDLPFIYQIRERMETRAPLQLISDPHLDHGIGVPLYLLTRNLNPKIKIIPVYTSGLDIKSHFEFGQLLKRELALTKKRVAVIASGELSHSLSKKSPAGYSPKGKRFDQKLIELIQENNTQELISLDKNLVRDAKECGLKSIAMLMGALDGAKQETKIMSYEAPFGVGYLTAYFK